ncbi:MAG: hypothetical protein ACPL3Q_05390, partial [Candidatus Ratteibacteria bacterium]
NFYGNHSNWACELSMAMYSLIYTCILVNISPRKYLNWYFENCMKKKSEFQRLEQYLPHKLTKDIKKEIELRPP